MALTQEDTDAAWRPCVVLGTSLIGSWMVTLAGQYEQRGIARTDYPWAGSAAVVRPPWSAIARRR